MSSVSEDHSESDESWEELEEPPKSKKANRKRTNSNGDSDHSKKSDNISSPKANNNVLGAALVPEDSELSGSESDASVGNNQKRKTQSGSSTHVKRSSKSTSEDESDSSAGRIPTHKIKVEKESSDETSKKSESSAYTSNKNVHKFDRRRGGKVGSDKDSDICTNHIKQEYSLESTSEDEGSAKKTSSSKGNKKSKLFALTECEEKSLSKSSDTDEGSSRKSEVSEDEDDPEITKVQRLIHGNRFSFSEENLINHSSGIINLETLSNNDLWLIHSPKMLSDDDLQGVDINFSSGAHHKIGKQKYQFSLFPEKGTVACVLPSEKAKEFLVVGLPVEGSLVIEESVKLPKPVKNTQLTYESGVKFPENLKVRHPLFGADYKERLSKSLDLKRRMKSSEKRKSKGKERFPCINESVASSANLTETKLNKSPEKQKKRDSMSHSLSVTVKSHRKRRGSDSETNGLVNNESSSKSPKKRKRDKVEDDSAHSEILEPSQVKKRKIIESEDARLNESVTSSKKKNRKVENSEELLSQTPPVEESSKKSGLEGTFMKTIENIKEEVLSSSEMSLEDEMRKKKKKEKRKSKSDA